MALVKAVSTYWYKGWPFAPGQTVSVSDQEALEAVRDGLAEYVDKPQKAKPKAKPKGKSMSKSVTLDVHSVETPSPVSNA